MDFRKLVFITCLSQIAAPGAGQEIDIKGFYSIGAAWLESGDKEFYYELDYDDKVNFRRLTKLGLNLNSSITDRVTFYGQILAQQFNDDAVLRADWMFLTYEYSDQINIRLGKIKSNAWFASDYIDVGKAYLWATPPEEVYQIFPLKSYNGASINYQTEIGEVSASLEIGAGKFLLMIPSAGTVSNGLRAPQVATMNLNLEYKNYTLKFTYFDVEIQNLLNNQVIANSESTITSIAFQAKYDRLTILTEYAVINSDPEKPSKIENAQAEFNRTLKDMNAASENLRLAREEEAQAEAALSPNDQDSVDTYYRAVANRKDAEETMTAAQRDFGIAAAGRKFAVSKIDGMNAAYLTLGYRIFENTTPYITAARLETPDPPGYLGDQRSLAIGITHDINFNLDIKFEAKAIEPLHGDPGFFRPRDFSNQDPPDVDRAMKYTIVLNSIF